MFAIVKSCRKHGALTINDVYVRNTRKGMDCKYCNQESAVKRRLADPEKFKERGKKYRHVLLPIETTERICSGCKKSISKENFTNSDWNLRHPYCKPCRSIANYKSKIKNKETYYKYRIKASEASRKSYLMNTWGMTIKEFDDLKEKQKGLCAICKISPNKFHIDHNHENGKIRSLLCGNCNRGIGYLKESETILNAAIEYLKLHSM